MNEVNYDRKSRLVLSRHRTWVRNPLRRDRGQINIDLGTSFLKYPGSFVGVDCGQGSWSKIRCKVHSHWSLEGLEYRGSGKGPGPPGKVQVSGLFSRLLVSHVETGLSSPSTLTCTSNLYVRPVHELWKGPHPTSTPTLLFLPSDTSPWWRGT